MYGAEIRNSSGSTLLNDKEIPVLYWGKKTITVPAYVPSEGVTFIDLFNIPKSIATVVYVQYVSTSTNPLAKIAAASWVDDGGANSRLAIANRSFIDDGFATRVSITAHVYVFIPARYIPLPTYGMFIKDSTEQIVFHTGRPQLSLEGIVSVAGGAENTQNITGSYAAMVQVMDVQYIFQGTNPGFESYDSFVYAFGASNKAGVTTLGLFVSRVIADGVSQLDASIYVNNATTPIAIPYIDRTRYDQYPSLGNYA